MTEPEKLYQTYRQSVRELWCILGIWVVFAAWNVGFGALTAFDLPEPGEAIPTILGMPKWIFLTVLLPWILGNIVIIWFALFFMKDTPPQEEGADGS